MVPFGNPTSSGLWWVSWIKFKWSLYNKATVIPDLPSKLSGSFKSNAIPIKFATGANVIYLLFKFTLTFNLLFSLKTA